MSLFSNIKKPGNVLLLLILGLVGLFFILLFVEIGSIDFPVSWQKSYSKNYDNPYDCKLVFKEIEEIFPGKSIKALDGQSELLEKYSLFSSQIDNYESEETYESEEWSYDEDDSFSEEETDVEQNTQLNLDFYILTQIQDVIDDGYYDLPEIPNSNIVIVGESNIGQDAMEGILSHVYAGNSALIASEEFRYLSHFIPIETSFESDSVNLKFTNTDNKYHYKSHSVNRFFSNAGIPQEMVKAVNSDNKPVLLQIPFGKGYVYLSSTPLAFTNYNLLKGSNAEFIEKTFTMLPIEDVYWADNYVYSGESNNESALDYIKKQPPLWWAFNVVLYTMIIFMLVGLKRKQRLIPEFSKPKNSTLEFVRTMAQLYIQTGGNTLLAHKKIVYFLDYLRKNYHLDTDSLDDEFTLKLGESSGKNQNEISFMIKLINEITTKDKVDRKDLIILHRTIENFKSI